MRIGFVGLGRMGLPMAGHLAGAGHTLRAYNRTSAKAASLDRESVEVVDSPAAAATDVDALITMLSDDAAVEEVMFGKDGALGRLPVDAVHVSMSTISVAFSLRLAGAHKAAGQRYVAAPVFGRPEIAEAAKLWVVASGSAASIDRCRPIFEAVGQGLIEAGEAPAAANVIKLAGNFLLAGMLECLGEAFALVRRHGLDPAQFLEVVNGHLFRSPVYEKYGKLMAEQHWEPAGFALRHGLKDVRYVQEAALLAEVPMGVASLVRDHFLAAMAKGWSENDWVALGRVVAEQAGMEG